MKKILILFLISVLLFVLDNSFVPFLAIKDIYPSLLFVFIICYSTINGKWEGLWIGVFAGMLQDIYFVGAFGMNAFTNMVICVLAGFIGESIFKEKSLIPTVSCFGFSILKGLILMLMLYLGGIYMDVRTIGFTACYNLIICIVMYKRVYKLCQKHYMQRRWKF